MGASQTKSDVLQSVLNSTSMDVMNKNSTASTGLIDSSNDLTIAASTGVTINGITQVNASKINVDALQTSAQQGTLNSDLSAAISAAIQQEGTALGYSSSDANVKTIVENRVNANITNTNLQTIKNTVKSSNTIKVLASSGVDATDVTQKNEAEMIVKLVSGMTSDIISYLKTTGTIQTDLSQTTASLFSGYVMIIIVIALVLVGGAYYFKSGFTDTLQMVTKPAPMILIGCVLVFVFIIAPLISTK